MVHITNASVQLKPENRFYKTIVNAKFSDQTKETISQLVITKEDRTLLESEVTDNILVILWK